MTSERLFLLDPYNDTHLEKITTFEEENNCLDKPSEYIEKIRKTISSDDYFDSNKNEFEEIIFIEKASKMTDCCYIQGERDIKKCKVIPLNIKDKNRRRHLVELATNYALDTLGMEEVFVSATPNSNSMITYLELKGFENLGEVGGNILLLKEKYEKENSRRMI